MKILKQFRFWESLIFGMAFFTIIYPYQHDMYIGPLHTVICVMLNGASTILFSVILYLSLTKRFLVEDYGAYLWFLILLAVGHGIFAFMNWGSWPCLGIKAVILVYMLITYVRERSGRGEDR